MHNSISLMDADSLVVHVSNLKRYYPDKEDTRHKKAAWSPATKEVGEILADKTWRVNEPRSNFQ